MKVLALNGSPKGKNGNTEVLLKYFLKGCLNKNAEVEEIYLKDKNIKHCCGCFTCWEKTPGKCVYSDDMEELLVKLKEADMIIYGTPLYFFTTSGVMKDFLDRTLPLCSGEIIKTEGNIYSHPSFNGKKKKVKKILISNAGFPGEYNFSALKEMFNLVTNGNMTAKILCPQGGVLRTVENNERLKELKELYKPYFAAIEKAGEELVIGDSISESTRELLNKEIMEPEIYVKMANKRLEK